MTTHPCTRRRTVGIESRDHHASLGRDVDQIGANERLRAPADGADAFINHLTRQSLAEMTGTTVETTIRIVSRWQKDRLVRDEGGRLLLADPEALRAVAEGEPA